jgi:type II secretory pathway component HofQ
LAAAAALALLLMPLHSEAAVFKCDVGGKTTYQATPCPEGRALDLHTPAPSAPSTPSTPKAAAAAASADNPTCQGEELSLNFQTTPLPMVLQVIAEFSGRRAQVDPSVTGTPPIHYRCTPWRTTLQDIAQRHQLDIRIEDKLIFVRKR